MRKIVLFALATLLPLALMAQAQIVTKKLKLEDFPEKTTKVVLTGKTFFDGLLKSEVRNNWRVSPFEFCDLNEFEKIKNDSNYYFLILASSQFRREVEPGLDMLCLVKGGKGSDTGISKMLNVATVPIMSTSNPSGREFIFLGAIINIIQQHALDSIEKDINGYTGLSNRNINLNKTSNFDIFIADSDISIEISDRQKEIYKNSKIHIVSEEEADDIFAARRHNTLVSYTVYPTNSQFGSYCYKMLIDSETTSLYYFKKHRITKKNGNGFLFGDLNRIADR